MQELAAEAAARWKDAERRLADQLANPLVAGGSGGGGRKGVTALEVDKMVFNPQDDWETLAGVGEVRR